MKKLFCNYLLLVLLSFFPGGLIYAQEEVKADSLRPIPGAYSLEEYIPLLQNKKVALLVNQTSEINGVLLPDTLLRLGVNIVKIFSPEHGFRGNADAGAGVQDGKDKQTGLPVISLYGKNKMPTSQQLAGLDVVIYDLQDVGARFYTYISTLQYMMEACGREGIPLIILDRPNPLGGIVDGPVLDTSFRSFVGMQPIPIVYGMTPGEYARMLIGEQWLSAPAPTIRIIRCSYYTHHSTYNLPVTPSPNLKNMAAIYLYPSLCLFEGTAISVGRGTPYPFQQYGHPALSNQPDSFRPASMPGAMQPKLKGKLCYGKMLAKDSNTAWRLIDGKFRLKWLLEVYQQFPDKAHFFNSFFNTLAGNKTLQQQIKNGKTPSEIRQSWQPQLNNFKVIRKKYLLYPF